MILRIIAVVFAFIAIALNFRAKWILENIFKADSPSPDTILKVKFVALVVAIVAFLLVFLFIK